MYAAFGWKLSFTWFELGMSYVLFGRIGEYNFMQTLVRMQGPVLA